MPPANQNTSPIFMQNTAIMISREIDAVYERVIVALEKLGLIQRSTKMQSYFYVAKPLKSIPKEELPFPKELAQSDDLALSFKDLPGGFQSLELAWSCPKVFSHHQNAAKETQQISLTPSFARQNKYAAFDWVHITFDNQGNILEILNDKFDTVLNPKFNGMTEKKWLEQHDPLLREIARSCSEAAEKMDKKSFIDKIVDLITEEFNW